MIKHEFTNTPHGSLRVYVSRDIVHDPMKVKLLDWLSIWGGADKVEESWPNFPDGVISWEFASDISERIVAKAIYSPIKYSPSIREV